MSSWRTTHKRRADTQFKEYRLTNLLGETASFPAQLISDDRRCTHQTTHLFDLPSPLKKARRQNPLLSLFADVSDGFEYVFDDLAGPASSVKTSNPDVKAHVKRYLSSDPPILAWIPLVDEYLTEITGSKGVGTCASRTVQHAQRRLHHKHPDTAAHARHPLDYIERWNGSHFERVTLKSMGLCPTGPSPRRLALDYCGCKDKVIVGSHRQQLLQRSWYPATHREPRTGRLLTYNYYSGLEKLTDNTGLVKVRVRSLQIFHADDVRMAPHLLMLKRAGRGNDSEHLVAETKADWESASLEDKFLYILYVAIDTCFWLKPRLVSSEAKDLGLGTGWLYFTEDWSILSVLADGYRSERAGSWPWITQTQSFRVAMVALVLGWVCALGTSSVLPTSAVDLQKGEQYVNMYYLVASFLCHIDPHLLKYFSMGNANRVALSVFMDGLEAAQAQGEPPAPPYASSDVLDLVPIEEPEAALLFEEGLSPSARARLEQAHSEIARNQQ
ncbi:hypothetical protein B0H14DRAFT_3439697 [Mycena olivaceomarginata]|nr:hypothetical protein B0H14DRAFT_3439697 [Mycena olivaceomarginata]